MDAMQHTFTLTSALSQQPQDVIIGESNRIAYQMLNDPSSWSAHVMCLVGAPLSGKTTLLKHWANRYHAIFLPGELPDTALQSISAHQCYALDDASEATPQTQLFHLLNIIKERGAYLVIASATHPAHWNYTLPDVASRMKAVQSCRITQPDQEMLHMLLVKLLAQKQLRAAPAVLRYTVARMPRSFATAYQLTELLDQLSLQAKRPITITVARQALVHVEA